MTGKNYSFVLETNMRTSSIFVSLILVLALYPAEATIYCSDLAPSVQNTFVEFTPGANPQLPSTFCSAGGAYCTTPIASAVQYEVEAACDPTDEGGGGCYVRATVPLQFPGNSQNGFNQHSKVFWFRQGNPAPSGVCAPGGFPTGNGCSPNSICGSSFNEILVEEGETFIQVGGLHCGNVFNAEGLQMWQVDAISCNFRSASSCVRQTIVPVDLTASLVAGLFNCPEPPPEYDCDCSTCPSIGSSAGGGGGGSGNAGDGAGSYDGGLATGPGARLYYRAKGVGTAGHPGSVSWGVELGVGWSHHYAIRIVEDPDANHVWFLNRMGSFREFSNPDGSGVYQTVNPSDEYRTLTHLSDGMGATLGWELRELDGTVHAFGATGRWTSTTDRFSNAKTATYTGGQLTHVDFPDGRSETFTYHGSGKLATISEVGVDSVTTRTWSYTWTSDELTRIDAPDGTALLFLYSGGYLTRVTKEGTSGGLRVEAAWEYTGGRVTRMWRGDVTHDGLNSVELYEFAYDMPGLPTEVDVTDPLGNVSTYHLGRDEAGNKPRLEQLEGDCPTCGLGPNTVLTYGDPSHPLRPTQEADGRGIVTTYAYDANGQVISRVEALGTALERETTWQYDATYPALVTRVERPSVEGAPETRMTIHTYSAGGALQQSQESGFEDSSPFVFDTLYTTNGAGMRTSVDPPGHGTADAISWTYDATRGDLIWLNRTDPLIGATIFTYDAFNRRTQVTDPNGVATETAYDALNRVTSFTQKGASPAEDLATTYTYTEFGDLFQVTLPRGNVIEYRYDAAGRLSRIERKPDLAGRAERTLYTLDTYGHRIQEQFQRWNGASFDTESTTSYTYSTRCNLDQIQHADGSVTEFAYDCNGNLTDVWDANHPSASQTNPPTTLYAYDSLNRLEQVSQLWGPGPGATYTQADYQYDVQDHLVSVTDAEGNATAYTYSDRDLMTEESSPVSGVTSYVYGDSGQLTSETDARGITTARVYDDLDRITQVDYSGTDLDITYTYDDPMVDFSLGRLTQIGRASGNVDYQYDRFGWVTQDGAFTYAHDANGNRQTITYPGGLIATYTFDHADREVSLTAQPSGGSVQSIASAATYAALGPLTSLTLGNGLTENRAWTPRYFPQSIELSGAGGTALRWNYSTDAEGNITTISNPNNAADNRTFAYQDVQYYLTSGNGPWGALSWTYDQIGNRLTETRDGLTDTYSYVQNAGSNNTAILEQIQLGIGGQRSYQHGPAGHMTQIDSAGNVTDLAYDAAGRLSQLLKPVTQNTTDFLYDGRSYLVSSEAGVMDGIFADDFELGTLSCWSSKYDNGVVTTSGQDCQTFVTLPTYSSEGVLHSLDKFDGREGIDEVQHFLYFAGRPVAQVAEASGGVVYEWITTDHLGTPAVVTDAVGIEVWSGGFEPFGRDYSTAAGTSLRLPGQWEDGSWEGSGSGVLPYQNVHRWYLAGNGRFSRSDPIGLAGGLNIFLFGAGNPVSRTDPLGLQTRNDLADFKIPTAEEIEKAHQRICARQAFFGNYSDMVEANWRKSDKYFHCKANCEAARCGDFGFQHACQLSDLRESFDRIIKGDPPSASEEDQAANRHGREGAREYPDKTCQIICARFRPKGLPEEY